MRPIRLEVRAFGPFAGRQVLDFRELGGRTFFLIHGPTGAGKSTLIDAMCFALYGETSGNEREARTMRSHLAEPEEATLVTFDFALGEDVYRVQRSPEQDRVKKRGTGTTREKGRATLWKRTGLVDDAAEGEVLATQPSKVDEEVRARLGFAGDQFRQVMVLPQGQFRKLLLAGSAERETVLETLFATAAYRRVQEMLKEEARALEEQVQQTGDRRRHVLAQAQVEHAEALAERHAAATAEHAALADQLVLARKAADEAQGALEAARERARRVAERDAATTALAALVAAEPRMASSRARAAAGRRAAGCTPFAQARDTRAREAQAAGALREDAARDAKQARAARTAAADALKLEQEREPERRAAQERADRLEAAAAQLASLETARREHRAASAAATQAKRAHEAAQAALATARKAHDEGRTALEAAAAAQAQRPALEQAAAAARRTADQARALAELRAELARKREAGAAAAARQTAAKQALEKARAKLEETEAAWNAGQAAVLAAHLADGAPCPVCGSAEHPAPARHAGKETTEAALKKRREELRAAEAAHEAARHEATEAAAAVGSLAGRESGLATALDEAAATPTADLDRDAAAAQERHAKAAATAAGHDALASRQATHAATVEKAAAAVATAEQALATAEAARTHAAAVESERTEALGRALSSVATGPGSTTESRSHGAGTEDPAKVLEEMRGAARRALAALEAALTKAQAADGASAERLAATEATLKSRTEAAGAAEARAAEASAELAQHLAAAGFADEAAWAAARMEAAALAALDADLARHASARAAAEERAARAKEAAGDAAAPELAPLEIAARERAAARDALIQAHTAAEMRIRQLAAWAAEVRALGDEGNALEQRFAVLGRVSDLASGNNPQRMTFERFVLAALLDEVLDAASSRLWVMSRQRYRLQRARTAADQRKHGGLDLEVHDDHTGTVRPVATLSGGESFLASLALALGLSDVVQSYAGGIKLDTLFVDEGFGSLDPEALEAALQALLHLRVAGRMVGIVSHVPELSERIDVRLEVTADRRGSRARFHVR